MRADNNRQCREFLEDLHSLPPLAILGSVIAPLHPPGFIEPCLPTISHTVPTGPGWAFEIKHDGFRFLAVRQRKSVRIYSRGAHDWAKQLPSIVNALLALPVRSAVLDGEGVICGTDGKSDFDQMRACFSRDGAPEAFLYAFDLLELDGRDLRGQPWDLRRALLTGLLRNSAPGIQLCEHIEDVDGAVVFRQACVMGLEGIVAKTLDSRYRSGPCREWIKVKNMAHPAIERAMLIALSKRVQR